MFMQRYHRNDRLVGVAVNNERGGANRTGDSNRCQIRKAVGLPRIVIGM